MEDYSALLTDYYQITMAYGYWQLQRADLESVFQLTFRKHPFQGHYTIIAGLDSVIHYLKHYRFQDHDLTYLQSLKHPNQQPVFSEKFLHYLADLRFSCDVEAIPEGNIVFPHEPLLRIQGPLLQCQLLETPLINLMNFSSLVATRAAQICHMAQPDPVIEFGMRRAQGPNGAMTASRAAYIGGCDSTSNGLAGEYYDIPLKGTMAHSWIMSYPDELTAFREFVKTTPLTILLVDTYDTLQGVKHAIEVGKELRQQGRDLMAVRLDSGDLLELSQKTRQLLDQAGFHNTKIIASGDLSAEKIAELKLAQAPIDTWGVGTKLITAYEQPALDIIYKLTALRDQTGVWQYKAKTSDSPEKRTYAGIHQVRRYFQDRKMLKDVIYNIEDVAKLKKISGATQEQDLLIPIFQHGKLIYQNPHTREIRQQCVNAIQQFLESNFENYLVRLSAT